MSGIKVTIERLDPMRIASFRVIGESPEPEAWEKLKSWAEPKGLLDDIEKYPIFGFNNPSPEPGSKVYGYEFWIRIGSDIETESDIEVKEFGGGLYAVTTCKGLSTIGETWMKLWEWVNSSESDYVWRKTHELEKLQNLMAPEEDLEFKLYLPIED